MATRKDTVAQQTLAKIEKLARGVVGEVKRRKAPHLEVPLRTLSSTSRPTS